MPLDDAARDPGAGVARLFALRVAALAEVVDAGVDDNGAARDGVVGALLQRDEAVVDEDVGRVALAVRQHVAQVSHVALRRAGVAVVFLKEKLSPFVAIPWIIQGDSGCHGLGWIFVIPLYAWFCLADENLAELPLQLGE